MSNIEKHLNDIISASLGKDVRQAIHDGIQECYKDGKAGAIDLEARQEINALHEAKADKTELAAQFTFKGSCLFSELPASGAASNDTWYVTDEKCNYSWNGEAWFQSSMSETEYEGELADISAQVAEAKSDLSELETKLTSDIEMNKEQLSDLSGEKVLCDEAKSFRTLWGNGELSDFSYDSETDTLTRSVLGVTGFNSPMLDVDNSKLLRITFDFEYETTAQAYSASVWVADGTGSSYKRAKIGDLYDNGTYEFVIDPAYYAIYNDVEVKYILLVHSTSNEDGATVESRFRNIKIYQNVLLDNGYTDSIPETILGIASSIPTVSNSDSNDIIVGSNGKKYAIQIDNDGNIINIPVIPKKALFLGNSLLLGNDTFGMAASDNEHDYFYLMNEAIREHNADYTATRFKASTWEAYTDIASQTNYMNNNITPLLTNDLDLVIVQLGDNVNTEEKNAIFAEGSKNLLSHIRSKCPKARVAWMGAWYQTQQKKEKMVASCKETGSIFIDIWDLATEENKSAVGNTYTMPDGTVHTITSEAVASHPGDLGFKAIANRALYVLGIANDENYYK